MFPQCCVLVTWQQNNRKRVYFILVVGCHYNATTVEHSFANNGSHFYLQEFQETEQIVY